MNPELASSPLLAKKAAVAIGNAIGADVIQSPDGRGKIVLHAGKRTECTTWYAAYCFVYRIRLDQIESQKKQAARDAPPPKPLPAEPYTGPAHVRGPEAKLWTPPRRT